MGFGILFTGYFLLLNFAYSYFTDAICAAIMLYAMHKLSWVNRCFKTGVYASIAFLVFGMAELCVSVAGMMIQMPDFIGLVLPMMRQLIIGITTVTMLTGISEVALEVGLKRLSKKCELFIKLTLCLYLVNIVLEAPAFADLLGIGVSVALYFISIVATLALVAANLVTIYQAYMKICMPSDKDMKEKESKLGFVKAFKAHEEKAQKEYAEYRIEKMKAKKSKGKK